MLSSAAAERIVTNVAELRLTPLDFIRVCAALAPALTGEIRPTVGRVSPGNGAAPPTPKPRTNGGDQRSDHRSDRPTSGPEPRHSRAAPPRKRKAPAHPVDRSGALFAKAQQLLAEQPDISTAALAQAAGCSQPTARRAQIAHQQAKRAKAPQKNGPAAKEPQLADERPEVAFLRNALEGGPQPASRIEEQARKWGVGNAQLEYAKQVLGIRAKRGSGGSGVLYVLPGQAIAAAAEA